MTEPPTPDYNWSVIHDWYDCGDMEVEHRKIFADLIERVPYCNVTKAWVLDMLKRREGS